MAPEVAPVLIAYDGSEVSRAAVRHAAELFAGASGCAGDGLGARAGDEYPMGVPDTFGVGAPLPDLATVEAVDRLQSERASTVAAHGAEFARSLGLAAEAQAVPDEVDVADTLIAIARERGAAVVVVGSHGISGLRSRLLGSVSRKVVDHCDRPVLVIRDAEPLARHRASSPRRTGALRIELGGTDEHFIPSSVAWRGRLPRLVATRS